MNREKAEQVKAGLTRYFEKNFDTTPDFFMADETHEGLREGAWSIAWEGWADGRGRPWTYNLPERDQYKWFDIPDDVFLEPVFSWCLGVYDLEA